MRAQSLPKDPRDVGVQVQFRCPFWYREQLNEMARARGLTLSELVVTTIEASIPPVKR